MSYKNDRRKRFVIIDDFKYEKNASEGFILKSIDDEGNAVWIDPRDLLEDFGCCEDGVDGEVGPKGEKGDTGPIGPVGPIGPKGDVIVFKYPLKKVIKRPILIKEKRKPCIITDTYKMDKEDFIINQDLNEGYNDFVKEYIYDDTGIKHGYIILDYVFWLIKGHERKLMIKKLPYEKGSVEAIRAIDLIRKTFEAFDIPFDIKDIKYELKESISLNKCYSFKKDLDLSDIDLSSYDTPFEPYGSIIGLGKYRVIDGKYVDNSGSDFRCLLPYSIKLKTRDNVFIDSIVDYEIKKIDGGSWSYDEAIMTYKIIIGDKVRYIKGTGNKYKTIFDIHRAIN